MKKSILFVLLFIFMFSCLCDAGTIFVATAKNARGALYLGYGPNPQCATEKAIEKCSQDSWIPRTCHVVCVRCEMVPDRPIAMAPHPQKIKPYNRPMTFQ
jgi:hypothetical protein